VVDRSSQIDILVVDDSEDFLAVVCDWIEAQPQLRVVGTARNGGEALEALAHSCPDLVLMDAFMPVLDGFETTRRIRSAGLTPLVVMLSVHEGSVIEHEAWAAGADGFVPKADFAGRLPRLIRTLTSGESDRPGGRADGRRKQDEGSRPVEGPGHKPSPTEKGQVRRSTDEPARRPSVLHRLFGRIRRIGDARRPGVVPARSLTEGGIG
jgi:CheY-like chemotaxis protein